MYIWKTDKLVEDLRQSPLAEIELKNYYVSTSVLTTIAIYLGFMEPREDMLALAAEAIGGAMITFFGINAAFKANGGVGGSRFIEKAVSISFPLLVKVLVAGLVFGGIVGSLAVTLGLTKSQGEWTSAVGVLLIQSIYMWRLAFHIRATNV